MYKVIKGITDEKKMEAEFNKLAEEGWELVSFSGYTAQSIWKKKKDGCEDGGCGGSCGGNCQCK